MPKSLFPHAAFHEVGATDDLYLAHGSLSASRIETMSRDQTLTSQAATQAQIWFSYFTAPFGLTITQLLLAGGTTAQTAATKVRVGLHTVDGSGNLALVFASADLHAATDATNAGAVYFQTASKLWTCPLSLASDLSTPLANYTLVRGQRYAWGFIQVTGGTSGTLLGVASLAQMMTLAPIESGVTVGGKTDLAASYTAAQSTTLTSKFWAAGIP